MSHEEAGAPRGLHDQLPRSTPVPWVAGLGVLWGLFGYSVLWEGRPFLVSRAFVVSPLGTVLLLPVRAVLRGIRLTEAVMGRSFVLAENHVWIGPVAGLVGAAIAAGAFLAGRAIVRRVRTSDPAPAA